MRALNAIAFALTVSLFLVSLALGMLNPMPLAEVEEQVSTLVGVVRGSRDPVSRLLGLLSVILYNNVGVSLRCVLLGITLVFPVYVVYANGYILGSVVGVIGYGSIALIPHGVFELPAILYSSYLGLRVGILTLLAVARKLLGRPTPTHLLREYSASIRRLALVVVFLTVAAFMEVFVSLPIGEMIS